MPEREETLTIPSTLPEDVSASQTPLSQLPTFGNFVTGRINNFNVMRLALAVLVVFTHSFYALYRGSGPYPEPLFSLTHGQINSGNLGVFGFFAISGCLVTASFDRSRSAAEYFKKRCLRIYPGYIICYLICILIVAPISGITYAQWLGNVNIGKWIVKMAFLRGFGGVYVFPHNPEHILNPSLWSISVEFGCYVLVAAMGVCGLLRRPKYVVAVFATALGLTSAYALSTVLTTASGGAWSHIANAAERLNAVPICYFLGGMTLYVFRDSLPYSRRLVMISIAMTVIASQVRPLLFVILPTFGIYVLFYYCYGRAWRINKVVDRADLSYGIYLYGWPVQQLLVQRFEHNLNSYTFFVPSIILTSLVAWVSWTFIEHPFLRRKSKMPVKTSRSAA